MQGVKCPCGGFTWILSDEGVRCWSCYKYLPKGSVIVDYEKIKNEEMSDKPTGPINKKVIEKELDDEIKL